MIGPAFDCALDKCFFSVANYLPANSFFELKDQTGPDGFNNGGRTAFLPVDRVVVIGLCLLCDISDCPSTRQGRDLRFE